MCFSVESSFTAGAVLGSVGTLCLWKMRKRGSEWRPLAFFPVAFAIQQVLEGAVWSGLNAGDTASTLMAGRGFLFFSHFFWPAFAPFAVMSAEPDPMRHRLIRWIVALGFLFGLSIMVPAVLFPGWFEIGITDASIDYRTRLIYDGVVGRDTLKVLYAAIVVGAFLLSTHTSLRFYGLAILVSVIVAALLYGPVFISVWCFFAAWLSLCVVLVLFHEGDRHANQRLNPDKVGKGAKP